MHLDQYLKQKGQSQGEFGQRLNPPASQGLVSQWVRGITRVTLDYALQIARETNDEVSPRDCADMYIEPAQRGASNAAPDAAAARESKGPMSRQPADPTRDLT